MSGSKPVDGDKFVCLDEGRAPPPGNCLVYSLGISNEWSFDRAITRYGCQVYAFDPSMTKYTRNTTEFGARFYKIGLGGRTETRKNGWHMMTLTGLRAKLGHLERTIDYLKIDIEGSEWNWLENDMAGLEGVSQMGMEVHMKMNMKGLRRHYDAFWRIQEAGFKMIHSNPNRVYGRHSKVKGVKSKVGALYELVWMRDG
ncbi:methyltransferase-like protein 24 [Pollicipes pollicipes]|uniref:methyltransferase-like protein 24 n=1 Tax=Pollicipes pollicipes TaxID=41117 RepID=UPI001884B859|nr:methyltransferase-like protein 24 [Pollicipes pollicipes]